MKSKTIKEVNCYISFQQEELALILQLSYIKVGAHIEKTLTKLQLERMISLKHILWELNLSDNMTS